VNTYIKRNKSGSSGGSATKRKKGGDEDDDDESGPAKKKKKMAKKPVGMQPPYRLSPELAAVVGKDILPRPQVISALWDYIKKNELQV
jgi:upstream activation factor subunit UAF30